MDMAAAARLISVRLMRRTYSCRPAWTGVQRVRMALALALNDSHSPQETRMRLVRVLDAGLPRRCAMCRSSTCADGCSAFPDLLDPVAGRGGEYNGADHKELDRRRADNTREPRPP